MTTVYCKSMRLPNYSEDQTKAEPEDIKVFKIQFTTYEPMVSYLWTLLNITEQDRAERYHFKKDKNRFVICRALLKLLISDETNLNVSEINLKKGKYHKPYLPQNPALHFNVSHSEDYAIMAIGNCELGVDVEFVNEQFQYKDIIPAVCTEDEMDWIKKTSDSLETFYKIWTRKEALVKAMGTGINDDFKDMSVTDGVHYTKLQTDSHRPTVKVISLNFNAYYQAALALITDKDKTINFYAFPQTLLAIDQSIFTPHF
ncbi:4'-phosphopantetheinyl transferase family protein [Winogradskyella arenosi]|uniref:4'-phosphopantetheinyl transferase n=1 Tax=Winogradskyella arenosi TaxID=533325 RepID=A0A368ZJM9_9FLAO|nr:4'-phosphopantetheinyl transferase superfamily protein [Winogradskyella arenosi]RCW92498.1 4'-phosphopantetheinyl transferase [Winogradskyella arenosi]